MPSFAARAFVTLVFAVFALSFVAETAVAVREFGAFDLALPILLFDSQNFIFFPLIGLAVLLGFWRAAVMVVDAYWKGRVKGGPIIFVLGLAFVIAGSWFLSKSFSNAEAHSPFEIAPAALMADQGSAERAPIMQAITEARMQSRREEGLIPSVKSCASELLAFSPSASEARYCLAGGEEMTHAQCCSAREAMRLASENLHRESPSETSAVHRITQPIKVSFFLVMLGIGLMLARRWRVLDTFYPEELRQVALPVILSAAMMIAWPLMNAAFNQNSTVLYGDSSGSLYRVLEQVFGVLFLFWAFAIVLFAIRSIRGSAELAAQLVGAAIALLGISQYQGLIVYVNRVLGIGADPGSLAVFAMVVVGMTWFIITESAP
jgi:hypothetical protein